MVRRRNIRRFLFLGHRYIGIFCALFVVMLAVTGFMLNHTESLKLDERHVQSTDLLKWYGISSPMLEKSFSTGKHWISEFSGKFYFDNSLVADNGEHLVGALALEQFILAALETELILLSYDGELIDRMGNAAGVPTGILTVGIEEQTELPVIKTVSGSYRSDAELIGWQKIDSQKIHWSKPQVPPVELTQQITESYRGNGLNIERVLLDIHSGRIAGQAGVLFMDVVAIMFILLAGMGVWMWARR